MIVADHLGAAAPMHPGGIERSPPALLREPLEFLFAEHYRHRQVCKILEYLAIAPSFEAELIATADDFIRHDLALHVIDEEEDLFPLLRRRCDPEDAIENVLDRLSADHALDQRLAQVVGSLFARALGERASPSALPGGAEALLTLARRQKSHIALENAVVMPLARRRLTADDREALSMRLAARRGVILA